MVDGKYETNPKLIADKFNCYFTGIGPQLASRINSPAGKSFKDYLKKPVQTKFDFKMVNSNQVLEIIGSLKAKTSCGKDRMTNKLLLFVKHEISALLASSINVPLLEYFLIY